MEKLLTSDVAKLLNCTPANVRHLERVGRLYAEKTVTGVRLFDRNEVETLISERAKTKEQKAV
jgi:DNA-binding transcriptional MerR regulator